MVVVSQKKITSNNPKAKARPGMISDYWAANNQPSARAPPSQESSPKQSSNGDYYDTGQNLAPPFILRYIFCAGISRFEFELFPFRADGGEALEDEEGKEEDFISILDIAYC